MTASVFDLIRWMDANESKPQGISSSPDSDELAILQRCLDAAVAHIESQYTLPDSPGEDVIQAILMQATRYVKRRQTPEGVFALGDFGTIRMSGFDPDVTALLAPYKSWRWA